MKTIGAVLLVAGTCIGSGMIALPMVLAKLGLLPSLVLMLSIWFVMYYTSLINLELNLQAGRGLPLGELGRLFSGRAAEWAGTLCLKLLSYSLLAVFIYGGASILRELIGSKMGIQLSLTSIATAIALGSMAVLLFPIKMIDYANRLLFMGLLAVVLLLVMGLAVSVEWSHLPLYSTQSSDLSVWAAIVPVVFTSFGFQVIFHTLTSYCDKNAKTLKLAFLWGSLIPAIVYMLWTSCMLSVVFHENLPFYERMAEGRAEVGELIQVLSRITRWQSVQLLVWSISLLAIVTSIIGVGIGLFDSLKGMMAQKVQQRIAREILSSAMTVGPAYLAVLYIPNAFLAVLGFAGMILAVIAVILPAYLLWKAKFANFIYQELRSKGLVLFSLLTAALVIGCEIYNML